MKAMALLESAPGRAIPLPEIEAEFGYTHRSARFASYWRNGVTVGAWQLERSKPSCVSLEVKVNEGADA